MGWLIDWSLLTLLSRELDHWIGYSSSQQSSWMVYSSLYHVTGEILDPLGLPALNGRHLHWFPTFCWDLPIVLTSIDIPDIQPPKSAPNHNHCCWSSKSSQDSSETRLLSEISHNDSLRVTVSPIWRFPKIAVPQQLDGLFHGKSYVRMDDFERVPLYFQERSSKPLVDD